MFTCEDDRSSMTAADPENRRGKRKIWAIISLFLGMALTTTGAVLTFLWPAIFNYILRSELTLSPSSSSYKVWKETPVPITLEFYFFNWTNPDEIRINGSRPALVQLGPYVFNEVHEKVNITWNPNNTISFYQIRRWYFDEERSNGTLEDEITTLNVVALTAAFVARDWSYFLRKPLSFALATAKEKLAITRTAGELLFDGYSSPLITMGNHFPAIASMEIPFDKFGWFYERNGSVDYDGLFTMHTGVDDVNLLGILNRWNGADRTKFFPGTCGMVNGSAGELWPPGRKKNETIAMFSPDLCRSIEFPFSKETTVHGILGYEYSGGVELLDNHTDCFCGGDCVPSGVLNVSTCRYGAPAFVSYPHFYLADGVYLQQVDGMNPDQEKHRFYITLEPETGIPLDVAARFQINILLQPHQYISLLKDVPRIFFPVLWFEERASMTAELALPLSYLLLLPSIGIFSSLAMIAVGLVLVMIACVVLFRVPKENTNKEERWPLKGDPAKTTSKEAVKLSSMPLSEMKPEENPLVISSPQ